MINKDNAILENKVKAICNDCLIPGQSSRQQFDKI